MDFGQLLNAFAHDDKVLYALLLIGADFILGAGAAAYRGTFAFSYVADTLRTDVLGKLFPWFIVYAADRASHGAGLIGPVDFGDAAGAAYALLVVAVGASIVKSLGDFGVNLPAPLARGEKPGPVPPLPPVADTRQ